MSVEQYTPKIVDNLEFSVINIYLIKYGILSVEENLSYQNSLQHGSSSNREVMLQLLPKIKMNPRQFYRALRACVNESQGYHPGAAKLLLELPKDFGKKGVGKLIYSFKKHAQPVPVYQKCTSIPEHPSDTDTDRQDDEMSDPSRFKDESTSADNGNYYYEASDTESESELSVSYAPSIAHTVKRSHSTKSVSRSSAYRHKQEHYPLGNKRKHERSTQSLDGNAPHSDTMQPCRDDMLQDDMQQVKYEKQDTRTQVIAENQAKVSKLKKKKLKLTKSQEQLTHQIERLQLDSIKTELTISQDENQKLKEEVKTEKEQLTHQIEQLQKELDNMKTGLTISQEENQNMKEDVKVITTEKEELKQHLQEEVDNKKKLEEKVKESQDKNQDLEIAVNTLTGENEKLTQQLQEEADNKKKLEAEVKESQDKNQDLEVAVNTLTGENQKLTQQIEQLQLTLKQDKVATKQLVEKLESDKISAIDALKKENEQINTDQCSTLIAEQMKLVEKNKRLEESFIEECNILNSKIRSQKQEITTLEGKLQDQQEQCSTLIAEQMELVENNKRFEKSFIEECNMLNSKIRSQKQEITTLEGMKNTSYLYTCT